MGATSRKAWASWATPILRSLTQRAEYRRPVEIIAKEMTRKWIKFVSNATTDKTAQIKQLEEAFDHFRIKEFFKKAAEGDGYYGPPPTVR
jgi:hypothetical protein